MIGWICMQTNEMRIAVNDTFLACRQVRFVQAQVHVATHQGDLDLVELHDRELITSGFMEWSNYTKIDQTYGGHKTSGDDVHQP